MPKRTHLTLDFLEKNKACYFARKQFMSRFDKRASYEDVYRSLVNEGLINWLYWLIANDISFFKWLLSSKPDFMEHRYKVHNILVWAIHSKKIRFVREYIANVGDIPDNIEEELSYYKATKKMWQIVIEARKLKKQTA